MDNVRDEIFDRIGNPLVSDKFDNVYQLAALIHKNDVDINYLSSKYNCTPLNFAAFTKANINIVGVILLAGGELKYEDKPCIWEVLYQNSPKELAFRSLLNILDMSKDFYLKQKVNHMASVSELINRCTSQTYLNQKDNLINIIQLLLQGALHDVKVSQSLITLVTHLENSVFENYPIEYKEIINVLELHRKKNKWAI
jgi:hypothetical protein